MLCPKLDKWGIFGPKITIFELFCKPTCSLDFSEIVLDLGQ